MNTVVSLALGTSTVLFLGLLAALLCKRRGPAYSVLACKTALGGVVVTASLSLVSWHLPVRTLHIALNRESPINIPTSVQVKAKPLPKELPSPRVRADSSVIGPPSGLREADDIPILPMVQPRPSFQVAPSVLLCLGWSLVAALLLARLAFSHFLIARLRRRSVRVVEGERLALLRSLSEERDIEAPELRVSSRIPTPFLAGIFRPTIYLPDHISDRDAMEAIFAHELAHVRLHDCAWRLGQNLLCILLWPSPLIWLLARRFEMASEELCDQLVIQGRGNRVVYARTLCDLAQRLNVKPSPATVGVVGIRSALGRRVALILDRSRTFATRTSRRSAWSIPIAGLVVASCCSLLITVSSAIATKAQMWRFTADSDPKATAIINQMVDTYHSMSAFSCTATFSDGQRSVVTNIQYLRSGYARVRIGNLVEGFVSPTETTVVHNAGWKSITILPTSPQVPEGLRGLTSLPAINTFVDDLPPLLESGGAEIGQIKATYLERRSSSTGDIDIVKLQYPKGTTKFLQVGTTDHLLYKAANHHTTLEGSTRQVDGTVSYSQILVNPPLTVEQLQFRAPKGVDVVDMRSKPSAEAEAILKSMVETYRTIGAMTLVDHFYQEIRIPNGILKGSWKMDAAYKLPGDVRALITPTANGRDYELEVLHGGTLSVAEGGAKHNYLRLSDDTPQVEEFGGLGSMAGRFQTMALLAHLAGETNVPFLHQDFKVAGRALLNGVPVLKLIATKMPPWKYSMGTQTISLYIGERDHLLHRAETETIYKKRRSSEITTEDISFQTTGRGNVPDGLFIFTPPQGMKAVQEPDRVFKDSEHQRKGGS